MRTLAGRIAGKSRALCFVALVIAFTWTSALAQVNSWTNPASGNWDQATNWSLAVLPNSSQSVMITNSGWKAVGINPSTPINFSNSMTVGSLTIRGATNSVNTLLLNFFGTAVPLTVLTGLTLQDGGRIVNFNSGLVVQGGTITVTNSEIVQDGGFVRTTNATMYLQNAVYNLTNGVFEGGSVALGFPYRAHFNQYGGSVVITNLTFASLISGTDENQYALYSGTLNLPGGLILIGYEGGASYFQAGGTNRTPRVLVEPSFQGGSLSFTLNGGLLAVGDVDLHGAILVQNGGTHVITNALTLLGGALSPNSIKPAVYHLNGGMLSARGIEVNANQGDAGFLQSNGTVRAETFFGHSVGFFSSFVTAITLSSGSLTCSNFTLDDGLGSFNQSGGALVVSNLLTIEGRRDLSISYYGSYIFNGGTVTASNINMTGNWFIGDGSTNRISNPGTFRLAHLLQISNAVEQLGHFILASNSTINLAGSASRLSFANSSGETWAGSATLAVVNWNGNPSGGGAEQLKFGTNQSGLTPAHLSQIQFVAGTNIYSAKILNTGEVVPDQVSVTFSTQGNNLVLTWPAGWLLQTATNLPGPFIDVSGATSPYTNDTILAPQRFFRLRQ